MWHVLKAFSFISIIIDCGGCDLKNFRHMIARAPSRRRGRYPTIGTSCNEWSLDFTELWSRSVHRPKNLTSRTRLRTASTRRRTRPIIGSLTDYSASNVLIIHSHMTYSSVRSWQVSVESHGRISCYDYQYILKNILFLH